MSVTTTLQSKTKSVSESRAVLVHAGNRFRVSETAESKRNNASLKKKPRRPVSEMAESVVRNNVSVDSSCSGDSSCSSGSSEKLENLKPKVKRNGLKSVKVVPDRVDLAALSVVLPVPARRCEWITPHSDPLYISFHDEEWGLPVHDDRKLFELLVFSQALAELSWLTILNKRDTFRKLFEDFDPESVAKFTEKTLLLLKSNGTLLLSEQKLRAVVENAKQVLKVEQEFGSFSNYCWRFVNNKPIKNGFRYRRQVPAKTPKAEIISKDMMQRGFCCVGPTVVYLFMQVAGIVNDHLVTCFKYEDCNADVKREFKPKIEETVEVELTKA